MVCVVPRVMLDPLDPLDPLELRAQCLDRLEVSDPPDPLDRRVTQV
jgi:hypothetical protein